MTAGIIDLGSNSVKLSVYDILGDREIVSMRKVTRLGQNTENGMLAESSVSETLKTLDYFLSVCRENNCEETEIIATSAVRDAKNRKEFECLIREKLGAELRVISGKEEAELVYKGLYPKGKTLVADIGGGSVEFALGAGDDILFSESLPFGAVRMSDAFFRDGISEMEAFGKLCDYLMKELASSVREIRKIGFDDFVGVGGTFENLCSFTCHRTGFFDYCLSEDLIVSAGILLEMPLNERKKQKGINPDRADIIGACGAILKTVLLLCCAEKVRMSGTSLRDGIKRELKEKYLIL
ncbi:MAG: hypothetical protein KBT47_05380 [Armatimonadetes bacterium]|nr:hypothetical protein [Candidatus Hippobium faecium]